MKILIILGLIFTAFLVGTAVAVRYVKNLLGIKSRSNINMGFQQKSNNDDVLYQKDDIVVMKGSANRETK
ncbi:MAG: hypothetical protein KIT33_05180 [Candidatus Kapabacteria bacterium]|nr:hypothetical protein [Ignavibacteriota bacterium]MCW5884349.1 hypothetical protein [Candidatus Kapabacteria bacterium]